MMQNKKKPTVASVAKAANVSRASVYAVLNANKENINIRVSDKIKEKILKAADELGYVRNETARTLVSGKTYTIGVLLTSMENQFFDPMINEIYRIADERSYSISLFFSSWDTEREMRGIKSFCGHRYDGIVWVPVTTESNDFRKKINLIESMNIPLVLIGSNETCNSNFLGQIRVSTKTAVEIGIDYLISLGHKDSGIATAIATKGHRSTLHEYRLQHIKEVAKAKGLTINENHIFNTSDNTYGGVNLATQIAQIPTADRPTAILAADDMLARGLIAGLTNLQINVPEDISVLGIDDSPGNDDAAIPTTSVSLEAAEMGHQALPLLLDMIDGKLVTNAEKDITLKAKLIERQSCSRPERNIAK